MLENLKHLLNSHLTTRYITLPIDEETLYNEIKRYNQRLLEPHGKLASKSVYKIANDLYVELSWLLEAIDNYGLPFHDQRMWVSELRHIPVEKLQEEQNNRLKNLCVEFFNLFPDSKYSKELHKLYRAEFGWFTPDTKRGPCIQGFTIELARNKC